MAVDRVRVHTQARGLGIAGLVFSLIPLALTAAFMALVGTENAYFLIFFIPFIIVLLVFVIASILTIVAAYKDSRGVAIGAMIMLILGSLIAFGLLIYGIYGAVILAYVTALTDALSSIGKGLIAGFAVLAVAGLALIIIFIWASVVMCKFVGCCGQTPPEQTIVMMQERRKNSGHHYPQDYQNRDGRKERYQQEGHGRRYHRRHERRF